MPHGTAFLGLHPEVPLRPSLGERALVKSAAKVASCIRPSLTCRFAERPYRPYGLREQTNCEPWCMGRLGARVEAWTPVDVFYGSESGSKLPTVPESTVLGEEPDSMAR